MTKNKGVVYQVNKSDGEREGEGSKLSVTRCVYINIFLVEKSEKLSFEIKIKLCYQLELKLERGK